MIKFYKKIMIMFNKVCRIPNLICFFPIHFNVIFSSLWLKGIVNVNCNCQYQENVVYTYISSVLLVSVLHLQYINYDCTYIWYPLFEWFTNIDKNNKSSTKMRPTSSHIPLLRHSVDPTGGILLPMDEGRRSRNWIHRTTLSLH